MTLFEKHFVVPVPVMPFEVLPKIMQRDRLIVGVAPRMPALTPIAFCARVTSSRVAPEVPFSTWNAAAEFLSRIVCDTIAELLALETSMPLTLFEIQQPATFSFVVPGAVE